MIIRSLRIIGWSGSGKTTLIVVVLPLLRGRRLSVSTIKHVHHGFDIDQPDKDSYRHRQAGAKEVVICSSERWVLLHENDGHEAGPAELVRVMQPVDLVLVEGFKADPGTKLEVYRPALGKEPLWPTMPDVAAVASDVSLPGCGRPVLPLDCPDAVAIGSPASCLSSQLLEEPLNSRLTASTPFGDSAPCGASPCLASA